MRLLCVRIDNTRYPRATASGTQHALYIVGRLDATNSGITPVIYRRPVYSFLFYNVINITLCYHSD